MKDKIRTVRGHKPAVKKKKKRRRRKENQAGRGSADWLHQLKTRGVLQQEE